MLASAQKSYSYLPARELKHRARSGDVLASALYRPAAYGSSLQGLLWLLIGICSAVFFVLLSRSVASVWLALLGCLALVWLTFVWIPASRVTRFSNLFGKSLAPVLAWLLRHAHRPLDGTRHIVRRRRPLPAHTGIFQKEDLLKLIKRQQAVSNNRITAEELQLAANTLTFGDKLVRDYLTPRRAIKTVAAADTVGPILLSELHGSGYSRFPVYDDKPDNIIGTLHANDLIDVSAGGHVRDFMKKKACYVHEEKSLFEALQLCLKTNHHLLIVTNGFEEFVGLITIEDLLEQIIGRPLEQSVQAEDNQAAASQQTVTD